MEAIFNNGITFIVWLQGFGSWLVVPMQLFSSLGSENFFLIFMPVLYWCVDARFGLRVGAILLFSFSVNEILKLSLHGPRPYWFSTQVKAYAAETSFGVPSGHAQSSTVIWGTLAALINRSWAWVLAIFLILMIGLSRIFLAVHFPHDVLIGWAIGALILWIFLKWWDIVADWVIRKSLGQQIGLAFTLSMVIIIFGLIAIGSLKNWVMPTEWLANAQRAGMDMLPVPVSLESIITGAAALFGLLAGVAWKNSQGGFETSGSLSKRVFRLLPGLLGLLIIYLGLGLIFPQGDSPIPYVFRYVRYGLVGFWITGLAPWLFQRLNLASSTREI
jgi:membrane-associated phospholipid phosphatase